MNYGETEKIIEEITLEQSEIEQTIFNAVRARLKQFEFPDEKLLDFLSEMDIFEMAAEAVFDLLDDKGLFDEIEEDEDE